MERITTALLFLLLVGGCARNDGNVQTDPSSSKSEAETLAGVTSEYSVRLAEMPHYDKLAPDSVMREGLVAGDKTLHIAASIFQLGSNYGLDLIVTNLQDRALEVTRDDLRLVDSQGQWMEAVSDFHGAELCGLRGRASHESANYAQDSLGLEGPDYSGDALGYSSGGSSSKGERQAPVASPSWKTRESGVTQFDWQGVSPVAPFRLEVPGQEGRAWWAYWRADTAPVFPLTAFVTVEGRHLIFVFDHQSAEN